MPFTTVAGFGSAATILAAHASSYVGGPGQLMCIRHYAVTVAYAQNLKPQTGFYTGFFVGEGGNNASVLPPPPPPLNFILSISMRY